MKIASFNVNGVNGRLPVLLQWLAQAQPDVVCLQELKAPDDKFPIAAIRDAGYGAIWHGQKSWNGVAILARNAEPIETRRGLPGEVADTHSRYIEAAVNGVLIGCIYLPNGNPAPGPKFDYKLRWFERLTAHAAILAKSGAPVVLAGDYNVMPTDRCLQAGTMAGRCTVPAGGARCLPPVDCARLDGFSTETPSRFAHLHLLGLLPKRLWPECRFADRPFSIERFGGQAPGRWPGGSRGAWPRKSQRPRAGLDRTCQQAVKESACETTAPPYSLAVCPVNFSMVLTISDSI